jgi:hypothetical protein
MAEETPSSSSGPPRDDPKTGNFANLSDEDFYSWTTLFSLIRGNGNDVDRKRYRHVKDTVNQEKYCQQCEKWKEESFAKSMFFTKLFSSLVVMALCTSVLLSLRLPVALGLSASLQAVLLS